MNQSFDTVLCQSCGASNRPSDEKCSSCGAPLPGRLMEQQYREAKERLLSSMPAPAAQKIRELEQELVKRPDATAILIRLSSLYKDQGVKDLAVEYMEKAAALDPENKFLQQKLRLLIDGRQDQSELIETIRMREVRTRKGARLVGLGLGAVALVILLALARMFLFPDSFRVAQGSKDQDAVSPRFSSDGTKVAYVEAPRFTLFGTLEALEDHQSPAGDIRISVKPIGGPARQLFDAATMNISLTTFDWRPLHNEITFSGWTYSEEWDGGHHIYLVAAEGGEPRKIATGMDYAWSPDGGKLAYVNSSWMEEGGQGLFLLLLDSGALQHLSDLDCAHPDWSPDGKNLIFQGQDRQRLMDAAADLWAGKGTAGTEDLFSRYVGDIYQYNTDTGQVSQITDTGAFRSPRFTPDGGKIAALKYSDARSFSNTLVVLNPDGSDPITLLEPGADYAFFGEFDFSPDGRVLAFEGFFESEGASAAPPIETPLGMLGGQVSYVSDIFTVNADGTGVKRLKSGKHKFKKNPVFSPDGKLLAYEVMYLDLGRDIWAMKR